jgi:hypothetical protein
VRVLFVTYSLFALSCTTYLWREPLVVEHEHDGVHELLVADLHVQRVPTLLHGQVEQLQGQHYHPRLVLHVQPPLQVMRSCLRTTRVEW